MSSAIIGGLMKSDISPERVRVVDPDPSVQQRFKNAWGISVEPTFTASHAIADVLVLAVKPQVMGEVLGGIAPHLPSQSDSPVIISIASGISLETLNRGLPHPQHPRPIVRAMPNTPALVGDGMTALVGNEAMGDHHQSWVTHLMTQVGECLWLDDEKDMDLVTALSGSGPAYFFLLAEKLIEAGIKQGLDRAVAQQLITQTALGAGQMLHVSTESPATLREKVTSPGGTTEAALSVFANHHFDKLVSEAVEAAKQRSEALGTSPISSQSTPDHPKEN